MNNIKYQYKIDDIINLNDGSIMKVIGFDKPFRRWFMQQKAYYEPVYIVDYSGQPMYATERSLYVGKANVFNRTICGIAYRGMIDNYKAEEEDYKIWTNLIRVLFRPETPMYKMYGGSGVTMTPRWLNFEIFIGDIRATNEYNQYKHKPNINHIIDINQNMAFMPTNQWIYAPDTAYIRPFKGSIYEKRYAMMKDAERSPAINNTYNEDISDSSSITPEGYIRLPDGRIRVPMADPNAPYEGLDTAPVISENMVFDEPYVNPNPPRVPAYIGNAIYDQIGIPMPKNPMCIIVQKNETQR